MNVVLDELQPVRAMGKPNNLNYRPTAMFNCPLVDQRCPAAVGRTYSVNVHLWNEGPCKADLAAGQWWVFPSFPIAEDAFVNGKKSLYSSRTWAISCNRAVAVIARRRVAVVAVQQVAVVHWIISIMFLVVAVGMRQRPLCSIHRNSRHWRINVARTINHCLKRIPSSHREANLMVISLPLVSFQLYIYIYILSSVYWLYSRFTFSLSLSTSRSLARSLSTLIYKLLSSSETWSELTFVLSLSLLSCHHVSVLVYRLSHALLFTVFILIVYVLYEICNYWINVIFFVILILHLCNC